MQKYDDIVVGSGISGLTAALLFAQNGRKVLLIEKSSALGGSLSRFYSDGVPFDTGFHFTGGLSKDGILSSMLSALGIKDSIKPIFFDKLDANKVIFEQDNKQFDIPAGIQEFGASLKETFKDDTEAIDTYIKFIQKFYNETVILELKNIDRLTGRIEEDYITFEQVLDKLTANPFLKSILAGYCLSYGTKPSEISYANHCRISAAFYKSIARVVGGGDAFVNAFKKQLPLLNVDVRLNTYIKGFNGIENKRVKECVLNTGETVCADNYVFSIHPKEILKTLPVEHLTKGFVNRVADFEPSTGFFSLCCVLDDIDSEIDFKPSITTLYSSTDLDAMLGTDDPDSTALIILKNIETGRNGKKYFVLNILETSCVEDVSRWKNTEHGPRPKDYLLYKKDREKKILKRIFRLYPEYREKLKVIESASILTYKDYLHSYDGSAYGIKQKIGQFNLFGRLPIRNVYAIGQSAVLPGIVGAMLSSFMLGRVVLGKDVYNNYLEDKNRKERKTED